MSGDHTKYHGTAEVPKREWAGLTYKEFVECVQDHLEFQYLEIGEDCWRSVEAKLKEKNT